MGKLVNLCSELTNYRKLAELLVCTSNHLKCYICSLSAWKHTGKFPFWCMYICLTVSYYLSPRIFQIQLQIQLLSAPQHSWWILQLRKCTKRATHQNHLPLIGSSSRNYSKEREIPLNEQAPHARLFHLLLVCKYRAKPFIPLQSLKDHRNLGITQIDKIR